MHFVKNIAVNWEKVLYAPMLLFLFRKKNDFTFIEFKNGSIESENIRNKINESLHIFNDTINENLKYDREHVDYILVYNPLQIH